MKNTNLWKSSLMILLFCFGLTSVWGQYNISQVGSENVYTQAFDSFTGTTQTIPTEWALSATPSGYYNRSNGTYSNNNLYSLRDNPSSLDNAIGGKVAANGGNCSGTGTRTITFSVKNNTGATITGFVLNWNVEQYSRGGRATTLNFTHNFGGTTTGTATFTATTGTDGNLSSIVSTARGVTISEITLANEAIGTFTFTICSGAGGGNNAHVGIDDFTFYAIGELTACDEGTLTGGTTTSNVSEVLSGGSANLSLDGASTGTGLSYQWQSSANGTDWNDIDGATAATYNATNITADTYFRAAVTCGESTETSTPILISTTYCTPNPLPNTDEYISNVTVGTDINNTTAGNQYTFYQTPVANLTIGEPTNISVTISNSYSGDNVYLYIDWNQDKDWNDANEVIALTYTPAGGTFTATGTITPPEGASLGNTRMRVKLRYQPNNNPCEAGDGEVEDYVVNILAAGPKFTANPVSISDFTYPEGFGPSEVKTFTLSGSSLDGSAVELLAGEGYQISLENEDEEFTESLELPSFNGNATTIFVRLAADLEEGTYNDIILITGGNADDVEVTLSGTVTAAPAVPLITGDVFTGTVGVAFSEQIIATENPIAYEIISGNLPNGLTLNEETGVISGTPTQAGDEFEIEVTATNLAGTSEAALFLFDIAKGTQSVSLSNLNALIGDDAVILPATTEQGINLSYNSDNASVASINGNILSYGTAGSATITVSNSGNANYNAFNGSFTVTVAAGFLLVEDFDYNTGSLAGQGGWAVTSAGTPVVNVVESSITYPGYLSSGIGKEVSLSNSGQDVNRLFETQSSTTIYASFLVNVANAASGGDYFFHLGPNPIGSTFRARVFVKSVPGGGIQFGISNSGTANYSPTNYDLNTTYLLVVKYVTNSSSGDAVQLYVNPTLNAPEPTEGWTSRSDSNTTDSSIGAIALRQGSSSSAPTVKVDGIRVAQNWYDIVGYPAPTYIVWTTDNEWSNEIGPTINDDVIIEGDRTIGDSEILSAKNLLVSEGGSVYIDTAGTLMLSGKITNEAGANSFTVNNGGNLIQNTDFTGTNEGDIKVIRYSKPMKRLDYAMWSSPVTGQNLIGFSPLTVNGVTNYIGSTPRIYIYDGEGGYDNTFFDENTVMGEGVGYLFRAPNNFHASDMVPYQGIFTGVPNNGTIQVALTDNPGTEDPYTSMGNPYPSNIRARGTDSFFSVNTHVNSIHFWLNEGSGAYLSCSTGGCTDTSDLDFISAGQGFIVEHILGQTADVTFTNAMRVDNAASFYNKTDEAERHRFWLNLSNETNGSLNQILTGYMENASNGIDQQIDAKLFAYQGSALYNIIDDEQFVIQGRALPFESSDVVPLGFRAVEAGKFKISLADFDGIFAEGSVTIYLKDNQLGIYHNLMESDYEFESAQGTFKERFEVVYETEGTMGIGDFDSGLVQVYQHNDHIVVSSKTEKILSVELFDLQGRNIHRNGKVNANIYEIPAASFGTQVLVVKIQTQNGEISTKKIINK